MTRIKCLRLNLESMSSLARASRSSGLDGGFVTRISSTGSTMPLPKKWAQYRLAVQSFHDGCFLSPFVEDGADALVEDHLTSPLLTLLLGTTDRHSLAAY